MPTVVRPTRKPQAPRRKARPKPRSRPQSAPAAKKARAHAAEHSPSWAELAGKAGPAEARRRQRNTGMVEAVPTLRFAVLLALACTVLTLYVGHLYASRSLVEQVQELRKEHHRLVLQQNRLGAEVDRMIAPPVVLERAAALGLRPGADYGPTIVVE